MARPGHADDLTMGRSSRTTSRAAIALLWAGQLAGCGTTSGQGAGDGGAAALEGRDEDERLAKVLREYDTIIVGRASASILGRPQKAELRSWLVTVVVDRVLRGDPNAATVLSFPVHSPSRDFLMTSEGGGACVLGLRRLPGGKLDHKVVFPIPVGKGDLERLAEALKKTPSPERDGRG